MSTRVASSLKRAWKQAEDISEETLEINMSPLGGMIVPPTRDIEGFYCEFERLTGFPEEKVVGWIIDWAKTLSRGDCPTAEEFLEYVAGNILLRHAASFGSSEEH